MILCPSKISIDCFPIKKYRSLTHNLKNLDTTDYIVLWTKYQKTRQSYKLLDEIYMFSVMTFLKIRIDGVTKFVLIQILWNGLTLESQRQVVHSWHYCRTNTVFAELELFRYFLFVCLLIPLCLENEMQINKLKLMVGIILHCALAISSAQNVKLI